jgi:predicted ABC-type sugar transport system permease subunit
MDCLDNGSLMPFLYLSTFYAISTFVMVTIDVSGSKGALIHLGGSLLCCREEESGRGIGRDRDRDSVVGVGLGPRTCHFGQGGNYWGHGIGGLTLALHVPERRED